jgi:glycosyltransferase involved in cell wall biosynthesis
LDFICIICIALVERKDPIPIIRWKTNVKILAIIPAFNEEANIGKVVQSIQEHAPTIDIVVVNDCSSDHTAKIAENLGAIVISHPYNLGYGATCQTGFKFASRNGYDYVLQLDGDGQHEPACIPDLINTVIDPDVDVVFGSRWLGLTEYKGPWLRRFGKFYFAWLANLVTNHTVTDPTTGFQALTRHVVDFYCTEVYPVDYPDADMIIILDRAGFHIKEIPVIMYQNNTGKSMHSGILKPLYYGFKMMLSIGMTLLRDDRNLSKRFLVTNEVGSGLGCEKKQPDHQIDKIPAE